MIDIFIIPKSQFWDPLGALYFQGLQEPKKDFWCRQRGVFSLKRTFGVGKFEFKKDFWCSLKDKF
jgi:hypothetical protein